MTNAYIAAALPEAPHGITRYGIFNTNTETFVARESGRTVTFEDKRAANTYVGLYNDGLMVE
jgi:hypothetical protein